MEYKGYNIFALGTFPMFEIRAKGQGMVPAMLNGYFSTQVDAKRQIDLFLNSLLKGNKKNVSTEGSGTG